MAPENGFRNSEMIAGAAEMVLAAGKWIVAFSEMILEDQEMAAIVGE